MPPLPPRPMASPDTLHPVILPDGTVHKGTVYLKAAIDHPCIEVGDYTYASAFHPPEDWAYHLVPYIYPTSPEKLVIGKFCQIADGVTFITASANHSYDGFSSFPFAIFTDMDRNRPSMPAPGPDTIVGHDVWIGQGATILPGARVGDGCIIGAKSVVSGNVPPYTIMAGNPARPVRRRFEASVIARLQEIAWWEWPMEQIDRHEAAICGGDLAALEAACSD